jgi:hypothetical protein
MDERINKGRSETAAHRQLKRLALLWAQGQGYTACALEVSLPQCRFRADVAAYRPGATVTTAIFECKQARPDLRRDNCSTEETRRRLVSVQKRREVLEKHLRVHYPALRIADSLFPEFDSHNFAAIEHHTYQRVVRELNALHTRVTACAKFETLLRYRCANLFFLVLSTDLYYESEVPPGWGVLVESGGALVLRRKPSWHDVTPERGVQFLHCIARTGTRALNRAQQITFEDVLAERAGSYSAAG